MTKERKAKINEIFDSIQGEGPFIGYRQIFVRFCGCNLLCDYCDTEFDKGEDLSPNELLEKIKRFDLNNVQSISLTGGEPLLHYEFLKEFLPKLKKEILNHNGCMLMRGDSGDCVEVVTKTVFKLWEHFGGTVNSKGYKVLDPHVKAIYGDSITVQRCEEIYKILEENGFACSNVALGVGSFSFQCIEEDGELKPFTRDTFSSCIKATYCEIDGKPTPIFKNPKDGGFKKSQKGCCVVFEHDCYLISPTESVYNLGYSDGYTWDEACVDPRNLLETVFKDGEMIKEYTLQDIRNRLHGGAF